MESIETLNSQYVQRKLILNAVQMCEYRIRKEQDDSSVAPEVKLQQSVGHLEELSKKIDCFGLSQIMDVRQIGEQYVACLKAIDAYKTTMLSMESNQINRIDVLRSMNDVRIAKDLFDSLKEKCEQKYNVKLNSIVAINKLVLTCINEAISDTKSSLYKLSQKAKSTLGIGSEIELTFTDAFQSSNSLPEEMLVARKLLKEVTLPVLKDSSITTTYQLYDLHLRESGNVIINTDYAQLGDDKIDSFVLAFILRFIESFPLGKVNVHIFDRNPSYLYKLLSNSFQGMNSNGNVKRAVQIHTDDHDLTKFRDITCEDIMKKISVDNPDLYAIYEHDQSDAFNLVVLRDGLVDGNGYASAELLDTINTLLKPGDIGHKCGIRFLIVDDSSSFENNLPLNAQFIIGQIKKNCELNFQYSAGNFIVEKEPVEILHIRDNLAEFVQKQSLALADATNKQQQDYVTLDDVMADATDNDPGYILQIPIGKSGSGIVELPLSCKDENGTVAGQCIGYMVIGQSGSGKSSFFHSLVLNGCIKYSPRDLQFWLLDFKNGGASSKYSKSGLPHIRIIAENNKIDDALCLFQMILEEMERRTRAFNRNNNDNIVDYNKKALSEGLEYFPRIIIAIDEVQEIFRDDNASVLQKLVSSISTRMRSAGMHFIMVAQNLSDGKSYMLKDAFLPSASGRISFRAAQDIVRDSGFDSDFIQRKEEIAELKTGEAYVSYGKNTIQKVRIAYITPQDMTERYFPLIQSRYPMYREYGPLVIGSKKRLAVTATLQGKIKTYYEEIKDIGQNSNVLTAIIGEDAYRMAPLRIPFSQYENSSVVLLGSDKQISSSLCTSFVISLCRNNVKIHLFNADKKKLQGSEQPIEHAFMHLCNTATSFNQFLVNHRLNEFKDVVKEMYSEYLKRQKLVQQASEEDPDFSPLFLVVNDLFGIESFINNVNIEVNVIEDKADSRSISNLKFKWDIRSDQSFSAERNNNRFSTGLQTAVSDLLKNGWRYNIHLILAIKGDPSGWRCAYFSSDINDAVLFNSTAYAGQFENSYYLKEMLKNISNDGNAETMAVWYSHKAFSKIRPIIYDLSDKKELNTLDALIRGQ